MGKLELLKNKIMDLGYNCWVTDEYLLKDGFIKSLPINNTLNLIDDTHPNIIDSVGNLCVTQHQMSKDIKEGKYDNFTSNITPKDLINGFNQRNKNNMNRIEEIKKRIDKSDNVLFFDKNEFDSLKKITKTTKISDYEVETPDGWVDIKALHETIPYQVYKLTLNDGKTLECADKHIVISSNNEEVFVMDLVEGDEILTKDGISTVFSVEDLGYEEVMYDLELDENSDRVYFTNSILSHNTHLSKILATHVFGDKESMIRVDMSEYMEKHAMSKLIGAPPGYVGYGEGGKLTEAVRRKPYSVILFDEIEKAHDDIFNLLLQLLDEGHLTDSNDRKVDFKNALIIMTSNIGVKELSQFGSGIGYATKNSIVDEENRAKSIIQKALKDKFKPEFLNRIDETIIFNSLSEENIGIIIKNEIKEVKERIADLNYNLVVNKSAMDFIAKEGYHKEYGARPLKRAIQKYVEDPITDAVMDGELNEGDTIKLSYSPKDGITFKVSKQ